MFQINEYTSVLDCLSECEHILYDLIKVFQRNPLFSRAVLGELQMMTGQVSEQRGQFEFALKSYLKEYKAYYAGNSEDNYALFRCADSLEFAKRNTLRYTAEWMRKLSELMMAYPRVRSNDRFHLLGDHFTNLNRSTTQLIAAEIDRGERRSESYAKDEASRAPELSKIQFSAIAPREFIPGQYLIINIVVYEENYRHIVNEIIRDYEEKTQEARSGVLKVQEGSTIRIVISSPDYGVEDNEEQGVWNGDYLNLSFALSIPGDYQKNQILYFAQVYINEVLSAKLKFIVKRSAAITQKPEIEREDFTSAFVSYASEDRKRVAGIIQGMKKARPDMDIFFDVESIRSGANWKDILYDEIMKRDVLFLCWSRYAKESKWVDVEWRYALKHHGPDHIDIVPLDQPALCSPPDELRSKNFNERLLYIINSPLN